MPEVFYELAKKLEDEIGKIARKDTISPTELDNATKAVCLWMKIMEPDADEWMSEGMYPHYSRYSGARGRSPVTGRYISRGMDESGHYYNDMHSGYSGHSIKDRMVNKLEEMYDTAKTDHEKETVDAWIKRIRSEA